LVARGEDRRCSLLGKGKEEQQMRRVTPMLAAMALMVTIFAVVAYVAINEVRGTLFSNVEHTARDRAEVAAKSIRSGEPLRAEALQNLGLDGVFIIVRDGEGRVLHDTLNQGSNGVPENPVYKKALDSGKPVSGTLEMPGEYPEYVYAVPVDPQRGDARVVEAGKSYEPAAAHVGDVATILATGIGVAFLLSIAAAYLIARPALR
jgi:hypothetical protein